MKQDPTVYIEKLSIFSLLIICLMGGRRIKCFYASSDPVALNWGKKLSAAGLLVHCPQEFEYFYADLRDPQGHHLFEKINMELVTLASKLADAIAPSFYDSMADLCDRKRLNLFFVKVAGDKMHDTLIFLHAVRQHQQGDVWCLLPSSAWARTLKQHAAAMGVNVTIFPSVTHHPLVRQRKKMTVLPKAAASSGVKTMPEPLPMPRALIGAWYNGRTLGTDPSKRNELFWLKPGGIDPRDVLLYFQRREVVPTESGLESLQGKGVHAASFYRLKENIPVYKPGKEYKDSLVLLIRKVIAAWMKTWLILKPVNIFFIERMGWFIRTYALWFDFFKVTGIKINLYGDYMNPAHIPVNQALRAHGGTNVVYQWSHAHFHSTALAFDTDVFYAFSNGYRRYMEQNRSQIGTYVPVGYPWDMHSPEMKASARRSRDELVQRGAAFVVCYLDENSGDGKYALITHRRAREIYAFLLNKLLDDPQLGLIFKPGYIHDFKDRIIEPLKELFTKALATGRLKIIGDGHYKTDTLPAEAASAADLTIGLLLSGTAILEAHLTGCKTVFLDLEGLGYKDIYQWGHGTVVFNNCSSLWEAIARFRKDPDGFSQFGDLSRWVEDQESYRRGCGADHIASHILGLSAKHRKEEHVRK